MERHLQLQSNLNLFDIAFAIRKLSFCGALLKRLFLRDRGISKRQFLEWNVPLSVVFHLPYSKCRRNLGQNIWRLFHFLAQFLFTTGETKLDYYYQKVSVWVASRVAERLKTEEMSRKSLKCLDLIASTQPFNQKPNFDTFW